MTNDLQFMIAVVASVFITVGLLVGAELVQQRMVLSSPDPLAAACAIGKERACTALANRKP